MPAQVYQSEIEILNSLANFLIVNHLYLFIRFKNTKNNLKYITNGI